MVLRQQLQEIGIKLIAVFYNDTTEFTQAFIDRNNAQVHLTFPIAKFSDDAVEYWVSPKSKTADKLCAYKNAKVGKLYAQTAYVRDNKERENIYKKIHELIYYVI